MATQFNVNTYQEQQAIPEKIQAKQVAWMGETWNFQGYWRTWKLQRSIKKEVEFSQECPQKTHVEWLDGNQKNVWLLGLIYIIHLPIPKIFLKFPEICGAEERNYLSSSHNSFFQMHLWSRVNMFLESIMFPLEWWIKSEIFDFYIISPCYLTHFKFSGASKLHDPTTNMKLIQMKDQKN